MLIYLIIHILCAMAAWRFTTANTDLAAPAVGCVAAVLCFVFGPLALLLVLLLMLCQRG
ncbi:MAG TPA: hypothetical protein VFW87_23450 [Pirellulales bacterium]|nr:hypothetical protein [Pirellulales bacterium]